MRTSIPLVIGVIAVIYAVAMPATAMPGGWEHIGNINDPRIQGLGKWAVAEHVKQAGGGLRFSKVVLGTVRWCRASTTGSSSRRWTAAARRTRTRWRCTRRPPTKGASSSPSPRSTKRHRPFGVFVMDGHRHNSQEILIRHQKLQIPLKNKLKIQLY